MSEQYVTLAEVRDLLAEDEKKRSEIGIDLLDSQKYAMSHAQTVTSLTLESTKELIAEVSQLEEVSDAVAVKIADLLPQYPEDVRAIFSKERIALDNDMIKQITDIVAKYI